MAIIKPYAVFLIDACYGEEGEMPRARLLTVCRIAKPTLVPSAIHTKSWGCSLMASVNGYWAASAWTAAGASSQFGAGGAAAWFPWGQAFPQGILSRQNKAAAAGHSRGTLSVRKICGVFADEVPFSLAKEGFTA